MTVEAIPTLNPALTWRDLPRDEAFATKTNQIVLFGFVFWFVVMFVGGNYLPIPSKFGDKMKEYDKLIYRHRLTCIFHGCIAFSMGMYWYIFARDITDGRQNSDLELIML